MFNLKELNFVWTFLFLHALTTVFGLCLVLWVDILLLWLRYICRGAVFSPIFLKNQFHLRFEPKTFCTVCMNLNFWGWWHIAKLYIFFGPIYIKFWESLLHGAVAAMFSTPLQDSDVSVFKCTVGHGDLKTVASISPICSFYPGWNGFPPFLNAGLPESVDLTPTLLRREFLLFSFIKKNSRLSFFLSFRDKQHCILSFSYHPLILFVCLFFQM